MLAMANTPFGRILLYGDSRDTEVQEAWTVEENRVVNSTIVKSAKYSQKAHKYAMWVLQHGAGVSNPEIKGHLSNFLIMAGSAEKSNPLELNISDAELAPSRVFENFAALVENNQTPDALYLSMLNLKGNTEYHTTYETNALALAAYGEILMANSGYDGPNRSATVDGATASFNFMHSNSESGNVLMLGGKRHSSKVGDGILEGVTGGKIEYFRGGNSIGVDGNHLRDVMFMQPADGVNGYYLVMDHVIANNPADNVNVVWHPNSGTLNTLQSNTQYHSIIKQDEGANGPRIFSNNEATLTTFLATAPISVEVKRTAQQSRSGYAYAADYLYTNYETNNKQAAILTVLFPGDKNHRAGDMTRISIDTYSGAEIIQDNIKDVALTSSTMEKAFYDDVTFNAENVIFRKRGHELTTCFIKGKAFDSGKGFGFQADESVAMYFDFTSMSGNVTTTGSDVTFCGKGITSVNINGRAAQVLEQSSNKVRVNIPAGVFNFELVCE